MKFADSGINPERLRTFYRNNSDVRALLEFLGNRPPPKSWIEPGALGVEMAGAGKDPLKRWEIISGFRKLDELGCGWFKVGRHKFPTRFAFKVPPHEIRAVAIATPPAPATVAARPAMLKHAFR